MGQEQIISILLTICGTTLTAMAGFFVLEFREMRRSVEELNTKIALVIDKIETHEARIETLETRVNVHSHC